MIASFENLKMKSETIMVHLWSQSLRFIRFFWSDSKTFKFLLISLNKLFFNSLSWFLSILISNKKVRIISIEMKFQDNNDTEYLDKKNLLFYIEKKKNKESIDNEIIASPVKSLYFERLKFFHKSLIFGKF